MFDSHSVRRYFIYDANRSSVVAGTYFFKYLGFPNFPEDQEKKNKLDSENIYIILEPYRIILKQEILSYNDKKELISSKLENLLVVPMDTAHSNFAEIETLLIRQKEKDIRFEKQRNIKSEEQNEESDKCTFELVLHHFIEDLYVNKYFKEYGDIQKIKSALEHIPLLQGIIRKFLFDHYRAYFVNTKGKIEFLETDIRTEYKKDCLEEAYLNYSRFLSQLENEKFFIKGGWFNNRSTNNIDTELKYIESEYLKIYESSNNKPSSDFSLPLKNTKLILKRYGILGVLRLTLPNSRWVFPFTVILPVVVFLILIDILIFNLPSTQKGEYIWLADLVNCLLSIFVVLFLVYTICVLVYLWRYEYKRGIFPGIFLPRLTIAIIAGWITFITAENLFKIDMDIDGLLLLAVTIFIFSVTITFMVFEIRNYAPTMTKGKAFRRSLVVTGLAFVISYTFGFWVMSHINEKYMSIDNFMVKESRFIKEFQRREEFYYDILKELRTKQNVLNNSIIALEDKLNEEGIGSFSINSQRRYITRDIPNIDPINYQNNPIHFYLDSIYSLRKVDSIFKEEANKLDNIIHHYNELIKKIREYNTKSDSQPIIASGIFTINKIEAKNNLKGKLIVYPELNGNFDQLQNTLDTLKSGYFYFAIHLNKNPEIQVNEKKIYSKTYFANIPFLKKEAAFPNMLLTRALLAMFIGIVLQLVIQDKTITEPI